MIETEQFTAFITFRLSSFHFSAKRYEVESVSAFDKMTGKATKRKMFSSCDGKINQLQPDEKKAKNGHKAEDSVLFLQLKCDPIGKGVERNE